MRGQTCSRCGNWLAWCECANACAINKYREQFAQAVQAAVVSRPAARPVKVGDVVIVDGDRACRRIVDKIRPRGCVLLGRTWSVDDTWDRLTHDDGAPIDVEATIAAELVRLAKPEPNDAERVLAAPVPLAIHELLRADLAAAQKRIAELEKRYEMRIDAAYKAANTFEERLGEQSQVIRRLEETRDDLLIENARLRRDVERLQRKGGRR